LPKLVPLSESVSVCQVLILQINGERISAQPDYVALPSLTVHTAIKKQLVGSTLLIARLKGSTWSIELVNVSADGKEKNILTTLEI